MWLFSNLPSVCIASPQPTRTQELFLTSACRNALSSLAQVIEGASDDANTRYLCELGRNVAQHYFKAFFIAVFSPMIDVHKEKSLIQPLGQAINQFFVKAGLFAPGKKRAFGSGHYYAIDAAIKESLSEICARSHLRTLSDRDCEAIGRSLLTSVVERWRQSLRDEELDVRHGDDSEESQTWSEKPNLPVASSAFGSQDVLFLLGRRDLQKDWADQLSAVLSGLIEAAPEVAQNVSNQLQLRGDKEQIFWREWKRSFSSCLRYDAKNSVAALNWTALGARQFASVLRAANVTIQPPRNTYSITINIENLKAPRSLYSVGTVSFFDPVQFCFTHHDWTEGIRESILKAEEAVHAEEEQNNQLPLRQRGVVRARRLNVIFARVCVEAETSNAGVQKGLELIRAAANTLGFAFSVSHNSMYGGLKPIIETSSVLVTKENGGWTYWGSRKNRGYSVPHEGSRYRLIEFSRAYNILIDTLARAPQSLSPLQNDFLRAIEWYIQGRWEPEATRRFLLHYVSLEHIFLAGQAKKALSQTDLPAVHTKWRGLPIWMSINHSYDHAHHQIEKNARLKEAIQSDERAKNWDSGPMPRPEQVRRIAEIALTFDSSLATFFNDFAEMLDERFAATKDIQTVVEDQRQDLGFRLYQLAGIRNGIVHEALSHQPGIETAADELESILETVLRRMSNEVVRFPVRIHTIGDLAVHVQHPFG